MLRRRMPLYLPENDHGLFYWFDASDQSTLKGAGGAAISDGARVYEWLNKGTSPAKMVPINGAPNAPYWRTSGFDGKPTIDFNAANALILGADDKTGFDGQGALTVVIACVQVRNPASGSYPGRVFCINNTATSSARLYMIASPGGTTSVGSSRTSTGGVGMIAAGSWSINQPMIMGGVFDYANRRLLSYRDGLYANTLDPFLDGGAISWGAIKNIAIGGEFGAVAAHYFWGHVFEVLLWRRALTPEELVAPHHYLRTKWKIEPSIGAPNTTLMAPASEPPPSGGSGESLLYGPDGESLIESDVEQ